MEATMTLVAIVQARMGSTRLPGKALRPLRGQPLLNHVLDRIASVPCVEAVIVATTLLPEDDAVASLALSRGVLAQRGPVDDVLARFILAARRLDPRHIMRVTADCPLLDPSVCSRLWDLHLQSGADYSATAQDFAEGLDCEIITREALERSDREARLPSEREHVTLYVRNHPELFRISYLHNGVDDSRYRITVDEPADFEVVDAVLGHLRDNQHAGFGFAAVKAFLDAHPEVAAKNSAIVRNAGLIKSLAREAADGGSP
jgi:spore coat polysaccharide biosynthesis protein SpsF (cytidylyltransferase family)